MKRKLHRILVRFTFVLFAAGLAVAGLSACGGGGIGGESGGNVETAHGGPIKGDLTISSWALYMDPHTVGDFDRKYGTHTRWVEDVNDSDDFFGKMQPLLAAGKSGGRSGMVISEWVAKKMHDLGYLQNIDRDAVPNVTRNLIPSLAHPDSDPDREWSIPWQAGMVGLIVNRKEAPDVHSVKDLFKPEYKGRVGLLAESRDTLPLVMMANGIDPRQASTQDWLDTIDELQKQVDLGQVRGIYGGDYATEIATGNLVAAIGWSGDAGQLVRDNPDLEFRMPQDGCVIFTDNFVIPVGAPNPAAALGFINFAYQPKIAAQVAGFVGFVSPVKGVREILARQGSPVASDPFAFPSEKSLANCVPETVLKTEDEVEVNRAFRKLMQG